MWLLWGHYLNKLQQCLLLPHLGFTLGSQIPSVPLDKSLFPGPVHPSSSAKLWHGLSGAWMFAWLRLGSVARQLLVKTPFHPASPLPRGKTAPAYSSWVESRLLQPLYLSQLFFKQTWDGLSPVCRTPGLGHPVGDTTFSLPRENVHLCPFPFSPFLGAQFPTQYFSSCPTRLLVDLFYNLGCVGVFLPVSIWLSMRIASYVGVFLMFVESVELYILLFHHLDLSLPF